MNLRPTQRRTAAPPHRRDAAAAAYDDPHYSFTLNIRVLLLSAIIRWRCASAR